jgi:4-amino-4-deoxy-L-arabinose transferase-like glycosyltransferase
VTLSATPLTVRVARVRSLGVALPLGALVAVSFAVRVGLGFMRPTPYYFPDEYRYAALSRSLVDHGHLLIRGAPAHFLPVFASIVTAPMWLLGSVAESYRGVQMINALAVSLAAVPVFLLARQLGLDRRAGLASAAFAVLVPSLLYSSFILAEPIAYPIVLAAVAVGVRALDTPTRKRVALFVVLSLLAAFTRIQFAVMIPCFVVSLGLLLAREGRFKATLRQHWRGALVLLLVIAGVAAAGPARNTGYYPSIFQLGIHPRQLVASLGRNAIVLVFASGFVLVPGALIGLFYAIKRATSRSELAFALLTVTLTLGLVYQASAYGQPTVAQERYTFYILPLLPLAFFLYARRGWPMRTYQALLAFALVAGALITPLTTMALNDGELHSIVLFAIARLRAATGDNASTASLAVVGTAVAFAAVVAAASAWPRVRTWLAVALAGVFVCAISVGAYSFDKRTSESIHRSYAGVNPSWVDATGVTGTRLVLLPGDLKTDALEQLFWNRSVDRVVSMQGSTPIDSFATAAGKVDRHGTLLVDGKPLTSPVLFDEFDATVQVQHARFLGRGPTSVLYQPTGQVRLRLLAIGSLPSGSLGEHGAFVVWLADGETRIAGYIHLKLTVGKLPLRMRFVGQHTDMTISIPKHTTRTVNVPVCSAEPSSITFKGNSTGTLADHRSMSAQTTPPMFVADASACPAS